MAKLLGNETQPAGTAVTPSTKNAASCGFVCETEGTLEELHVKLSAGTLPEAGMLRMAVQEDNGAGIPKLGVMSEGFAEPSGVTIGIHNIPITPVLVKAGVKYWLTFMPVGGNASVKTTTTGAKTVVKEAVVHTTIAEVTEANWTTPEEKGPFAIWGTGTPSGNTKTLAGVVAVKLGQSDALAAQATLASSSAVRFSPLTAALHSETGSSKTLDAIARIKIGTAGAAGAKAALTARVFMPFETSGTLGDLGAIGGPSAVKIAAAAKLAPQGALRPVSAVRFVTSAALSSNAAFTASGATAVRLAAHATLTPGTPAGEPSGHPGRVNPRILAGVANAS